VDAPSQIFSSRARAKINLTLHVGAVLENGYHPLHSLVVFAGIGDELSLQMSSTEAGPRLHISGPFANDLPSATDNLILHAFESFDKRGEGQPLFKLVKNLPTASGIGGGSADAAAAIRLLKESMLETVSSFIQTPANLGADIPVCIKSQTCLMQGIGENLIPLPCLGQLAAVLVNPGVPVSTAMIFKAFDKIGSSSEFQLPAGSLLEMAQGGRNDLQEIAISIEPSIQTVLDGISTQEGCQLARMSGSGATCFGLFSDSKQAQIAANNLKENHPDWWCVPTMLGDMP